MLIIKALRCVNLRNVAEAVGSSERQDPYITVTLQENQKLLSKTDVCYAGGVNPHWFTGNWMRLPIPRPGMTCLIQVWDKHSLDADELIASGRLKLDRYDEDGTEDEPMSLDLYWRETTPAGKLHCVVTYDPPVGNVCSGQVHQDKKTADQNEKWVPWLRMQITHRSGKVKDFLISRTLTSTQGGYARGRSYLETMLPQLQQWVQEHYTSFRARPPMEQAGILSLLLILLILPWPRLILASTYTSVRDGMDSMFGTLFDYTSGTMSAVFSALANAFTLFASWSWSASRFGIRLFSILGFYAILPTIAMLCMPRALGLLMTKLGTYALGGHLMSFGTITIVPWITDFRRLKIRVIVVDMLLGNPRNKGYTPRLLSFNRFEFVGSVLFSDIGNLLRLRYQPCPLKDVGDFEKLLGVRIDHLELDGLAINLEVNDRNRLNLMDLVSDLDHAAVDRALAQKEINPKTFRFPNCLEVQVLGARNLRSHDITGLDDPYYVIRVRRQQIQSDTVAKTLNPNFPLRVEQFYLDDPSAVIAVELWDEDVARPSDFIGQWNTTAKTLLTDPKQLTMSEWESLSDDNRRQGWISFWAPLVDENFRSRDELGEVHLRMRWVFNPALPDVRHGERHETMTPLQQLNQLRLDIRQRLGDLNRIIDLIKHFPVLLDVQGLFILNDTKFSVHDIRFGRRNNSDNVVRKLLVKQREERDKRVAKQVQSLPRSLDVYQTPAAIDRSAVPSGGEETKRNDGIVDVKLTSADPNTKTLPANLDIEIATKTGLNVGDETQASSETGRGQSLARAVETPLDVRQQVMEKEIKAVEKEVQEHQREQYKRENEIAPSDEPQDSSKTDLKEKLAYEFAATDKLNAIYPEKLISSAPAGDKGFVRGDLVGVQRDLGPTKEVYLGHEEDDEAAEQRNEDRFDDDEREYDQDGREFIKIKPIIWRKQFLTRHGDPGINLWKFIERLVYGLLPKLASDTRLQKAMAGSAFKSLFTGDYSIFGSSGSSSVSSTGQLSSDNTATSTIAPSNPQPSLARSVAHKLTGAMKDAAGVVRDQTNLVQQKMFHKSPDEQLRTNPAPATTTTAAMTTTNEPTYVREREDRQEQPPAAPSQSEAPLRPVHGQDVDFYKETLVISGPLETVWQGRHRITSLFRRWKPWHVEIKGDAVYYHKTSTHLLTTGPTASEAIWYTLDLTWLSEIYLTDSNRAHNNELVMRFVQDDQSLHFRLPARVSTPSLSDWLTAFKRVQRTQQERRRLGSQAGSVSDEQLSTSTWPGEDVQPTQRQRGSSLAVSILAPKKQDVSVEINKPYEMGDFETKVKPQEQQATTSSDVPTTTNTTNQSPSSWSTNQQWPSQQQTNAPQAVITTLPVSSSQTVTTPRHQDTPEEKFDDPTQQQMAKQPVELIRTTETSVGTSIPAMNQPVAQS